MSFESVSPTPIGEGSPTYMFLWDIKLVIHNDSNYLARGIKLLSEVPDGWALFNDFPTRLEADQVLKLQLRASYRENQATLVKRYGTSSQRNMLPAIEADVFSQFLISIHFANELGRQYEQTFVWRDGKVMSNSPRRAR